MHWEISQPANPLDIETFKLQIRVDDDHEDTLLQHYLDAAYGYFTGASGVLGRSFGAEIVTLSTSETMKRLINLYGPIDSISKLLVKSKGVTNTIASGWKIEGGFEIDLKDVALSAFEENSELEIEYVTKSAPTPLVQAGYLLAAHWYANREAVAFDESFTLPLGVQSLIMPFRRCLL